MNKKVLGIIAARAGSKRLPGKHLMEISGVSLLERSIKNALQSNFLHRLIFSSDDPLLMQKAAEWGALVPFVRPANLATDESKVVDVLLHTIDYCKNNGIDCETICLLQPTSPFRTAAHIDAAINKFFSRPDVLSLMSVNKVDFERSWLKEIDSDDLLKDLFNLDPRQVYRGQSEPVYKLNGAIYIMRSSDLMKHQTFHTAKTLAFEMGTEDSMDIDELRDLELARIIANQTGK